jgi:hypothetical protein
MAKTAVLEAPADPAAERGAVIGRVLARAYPDTVRTYPDGRGGEITQRIPREGRRAPQDTGEWVDDRIVATFGGRAARHPGEACALEVLEAVRSGDPRAVRAAVRTAARGLDEWTRHLVFGVLTQWHATAPPFAQPLAQAAVDEARSLGWERRPAARQRRAKERAVA